MSRLIEADALIEKYGDWYTEEGSEEGYIGTIKGIVDSMPTIEPERKTGKWMARNDDCFECSECHAVIEGDELYWRNNYFCYHCGADMRGDSDEQQ